MVLACEILKLYSGILIIAIEVMWDILWSVQLKYKL